MPRSRLRLSIAFGMAAVSAPAIGQFDHPDPKVYASPEDQARARLLATPCKPADEGKACYCLNGELVREQPCAYHIGHDAIGFVPTDQCYRMDQPRRYRGVWVDEFEGQVFIPAGSRAAEWPRGDARSPGWKAKFEKARSATIWLDVERVKLDHEWRKVGRRMRIEFIGRKTLYPGYYGHMGMSGQEIIVDRLISLHGCAQKVCG